MHPVLVVSKVLIKYPVILQKSHGFVYINRKVRQGTRLSLPNLLDFDSFAKSKKMP